MNAKIEQQIFEIAEYILGCMLMEGFEHKAFVMGRISGDMFNNRDHNSAFRAMHKLFMAGKEIEPVAVFYEAKAVDSDFQMSTLTLLMEKAYYSPWANYQDWVKKFEELHWKQRLDTHTIWLKQAIETQELSVLINKTQDFISDVGSQVLSKNSGMIIPATDSVRDAIEISIKRNKKELPPGITTGYPCLDEIVIGFEPTQLIIIAARPRIGKTAFALNLAENMALKEGKKVLFFTMEMSAEELTHRLISSAADINQMAIRSGALTEQQWKEKESLLKKLYTQNIAICDAVRLSPMQMLSIIKTYKAVHGLDIVFVDYLQLMDCGRSPLPQTRNEEVSIITRGLKAIAKETKLPIVALSQLSRSSEQMGRRPRLSDLRDSGSIEQDANVVMFLHRSGIPFVDADKKSTVYPMELIIDKNRNGPESILDMVFLGKRTRFEVMAKREEDKFPEPGNDKIEKSIEEANR